MYCLAGRYGCFTCTGTVSYTHLDVYKRQVRAVGRVLDLPYSQVDRIVKLMPDDLKIKTIHDAMEASPELREVYETDPEAKELLDIANKIQGMPSHCGKHAAGVAISQDELISYMPVWKDPKDGSVTTQYAKEQVEACGCLLYTSRCV